MAKINENTLAKMVAEQENGKKEISIAQIKEVIKLTLDYLGNEWIDGNETGVIELVKKHLY